MTLPKKIIDIHNHLAKDDSDGTQHIEAMDANGIEVTLIMGLPWRSNDAMLPALRKYPDRLVGGAFIDPRDADAVDQIRHWHGEGLPVVKLFPNFGYYPDDDAFRPFFDVVAELNMAVLSHCGWLLPDAGVTASYYSHPGRFEKLIRTYTDTPFIMAHMGGIAGFLEAVMLTTRTPNTYVDCSPGQGAWVLEHAGKMAATIPPEKIIWGMDSCDYPPEWITKYQTLLTECGFGPHFDKVYYSNARGILEKIGAVKPRET